MDDEHEKEIEEPGQAREFQEGVDYYFENGLMVLTAEFLHKRGYCCGSGCRHCPYTNKIPQKERE